MANAYLAQGIAQGLEKGTARIDAREQEDFRRKQIAEEMSMRKQQMGINQDTNQRQQQAHNIQMNKEAQREKQIKGIMKQQEKMVAQQSKQVMQASTGQYVMSFGTENVGAAVNVLNNQISGNPGLKKAIGAVSAPNINNPEHTKQIQQWAMAQMGEDAVPLDDDMIRKIAESGQFLVKEDGSVVNIEDLVIKAGLYAQMPPEAVQRFNATLRYNNALALAAKGEFGQGSTQNAYERLDYLDKKAATEAGLTGSEMIEQDAMTQELKIVKTRANNYLTGPETAQARGDIEKGDFSKLTSAERDGAMEAQLDSGVKLPTELEKKTYGTMPTIRAGTKALNDMSKVPEGELRGYIDKLELKAKSLFSDKAFDELTFAEQSRVMRTVETNSRLGTIFSQYVQSISGAAVADQEFARLALNAFGGDLQTVNLQTLTTAFTSFINEVQTGLKSRIQDLPSTYTGYKIDLAYKTKDASQVKNPFKTQSAESKARETKETKPTTVSKPVKMDKAAKLMLLEDGSSRPMTPEEIAKYVGGK